MADSWQSKRDFLRQQGTLNPRPQDVVHETFETSEFFDAEDLLQVKYEMLRLVEVERAPISQAARASDSPGIVLPGSRWFSGGRARRWLPQKRGPRSGHKLTPELMSFIAGARAAEPGISSAQLADRITRRLPGLSQIFIQLPHLILMTDSGAPG